MKKISRRSFLKVSGTMAAAGALAACGGSSSTSTAASSEAAPSVEAKAVDGLPDMSKETLNFSSDKVGSGSYNMIVAMSKVLEKAGGFQTVNVNPDSPGGMGAPYLFASGNTDLAFINGAPAKWAMEEGTLGKPATSGYAAVIGGLTAVCYINCVSNAFLQKYNVSTIEEIFEQKLPLRIGCSAKGSMDAEGAYLLLEYFGVTEDDLKSWGGSTMAQIATSVDVTFLQWGDDLCSWFVSEKGFDLITIPANSFKGQDKELTLPGTPDCVFCKESLSEDVVYAITKSLSENRDALVAEYNSLSPWEPETAWEEMKRGGCPLHPGAEKYYKEAGYMK